MLVEGVRFLAAAGAAPPTGRPSRHRLPLGIKRTTNSSLPQTPTSPRHTPLIPCSRLDDLLLKFSELLFRQMERRQQIRTFHGYLHVTYKTVNNTQGLCDCHPSLVLGQPVELLQNYFDLALPQKLLSKLLCGTLSHGQRTCDDALTESSLLDLLGRQGKHRK